MDILVDMIQISAVFCLPWESCRILTGITRSHYSGEIKQISLNLIPERMCFIAFFVTNYLFLILASIVFDFFYTTILNENMNNTEKKIKSSV